MKDLAPIAYIRRDGRKVSAVRRDGTVSGPDFHATEPEAIRAAAREAATLGTYVHHGAGTTVLVWA